MYVKDRQGVQQAILVGKAPGVDQGLRVAQQVRVGEHDALGATRRPRRVQERGQVVGIPVQNLKVVGCAVRGLCKRAAPVFIQRQDVLHTGPGCNLPDRVLVGRVADGDRGFGIVDEIDQLARLVRRVHRVEHEAGAEAGQVQTQCFG